MRRAGFMMLVVLTVGLAAQFMPASAACTPKQTAAGGNKDCSGQIHCGTKGKITGVSTVGLYVNQTSSGAEVEACGDSGPGNQQGRAMVVVDQSKGARAILDTDLDQPFPPGYITVQAGPEKPGVWCNKDTDGADKSDGYARPWSSPGSDGNGVGPDVAHCVPTQ